MSEPRYIAFPFGAGLAYAPHVGNTISPAPRSYASPAHAQLANPTGRLYVGEDESAPMLDDNSQFVVVAQCDVYPLDLLEVRVPGFGSQAEGAEVLRDMGPRAPHRWATHFRNDQLGGYHGGDYFETWEEAVAGFEKRAAKTYARTAQMVERNREWGSGA